MNKKLHGFSDKEVKLLRIAISNQLYNYSTLIISYEKDGKGGIGLIKKNFKILEDLLINKL